MQPVATVVPQDASINDRRSAIGRRHDDARPHEQQLETLKTLLLGDERREVGELVARLTELERREDDSARHNSRVEKAFVPALRSAIKRDPDSVSVTLAPMINGAIRHEMKNSRDEMVAALHPLAGRLVTAAVADSFHKLAEQVNEKVEALMSPRGMMLRIKAAFTGQSVATLLLSELRSSELKRILVIDRRTGTLCFYWPNDEDVDAPDEETVDQILTSIHALAGASDGDFPLTGINLAGSEVVMQGSLTHIVALESEGRLSEARKSELGAACLSLLEFAGRDRVTGDEFGQKAMTVFAGRLMHRRKGEKDGKRRLNPALILFSMLAIGLIAFIGWRAYDRYRISNAAQAVEAEIARQFLPGELMLNVSADRSARLVSVEGIGFGNIDLPNLSERVGRLAEPYAVEFGLIARDLDGLRRDNEVLTQELRGTRSLLEVAQLRLNALTERVSRVPEADPLQQLQRWIGANAIFFAERHLFRDADRASTQFDELAKLLAATPAQRLRVTGRVDRSGSSDTNLSVATERAEAAISELVRRGVARERLSAYALGPDAAKVGVEPGPNSPNRRVEFSLALEGE